MNTYIHTHTHTHTRAHTQHTHTHMHTHTHRVGTTACREMGRARNYRDVSGVSAISVTLPNVNRTGDTIRLLVKVWSHVT